ncbi:YggS family pyridoxal phosphate-dependent enzyme [Aquisalimonas lutea]|uniref:YggS family pyridoxal phosphate-dependent enzyme n=1 Tax=Aquisalimonas lutea TaxID=1327750 RepID=UPI0025B5B374|nr:YggS family pyridoxal phosphate-dependent enzyme [Aquisalimonas lutea]MDN3516121.1 YggS family pyridoxal phosphate-dependent enzyme [Aquisalimonas lutea]
MTQIAERLARVRTRIRTAEARFGRPEGSVSLLAVSKTKPVAAIREALAAGQADFGENYLQDARDKQQALDPGEARWHFIGPLQSNKTKPVAAHFDWVHSVEREKIAKRLSEQRPEHLPPLNICLQVNVSGEATKSGLQPEAVPELAARIAGLPGVRLRGLMCIPAPAADFDAQRVPFRQLHELRESLVQQGLDLDTLSMGMSADLEAAVAEGSTLVRVGTDIFGPRQDQPSASREGDHE